MLKKIARPIIFIVLYLIIKPFSITFCQPTYYQFEYLTPNEGLSQASVMQIIKDSKGFMWFGTRNGLNLYDGYTFTKFYSNPEDSTSLAGDVVVDLMVDSKNNLWVATDNGFSIYNYESASFINYKNKSFFPDSVNNYIIICIYEDTKGIFWLGTSGTGLIRFDREKGLFKIYTYTKSGPHKRDINVIRAIAEDNDGNLWIATEGSGLNLFNRKTESFTLYLNEKNDTNSISNNIVYSMVKDQTGTIWVGTLGSGICSVNKANDGSFYFDRFIATTKDSRRLKILSMFADKNGGIWLGTENAGLDHFDIRTKTFINYNAEKNIPSNLNTNSVQCIYQDDIGNLWVGTYTGGVNVNKVNKKQFKTISKISGQKNSLNNNAISCFYNDKDNLWIGTDGGGLNIYNRKTETFKHYLKNNSTLLSDAVLTISPDIYGNIWVSGWECGLNRYDKITDKFINYNAARYNLPNNNIFDITPDSVGNIWIAYGGNGLVKFNVKSSKSEVFNQFNSELPNNWIFDLTIDCDGNIVIGHGAGFSILNPQSNTFKNYTRTEENQNQLSNNLVNTILIDSDSTYWVGTAKGLNHFNPNTEKNIQYFMNDGLPNNNIVGLIEDKNHTIWISTNNGISKFDSKTHSFRNYSYSDGLQGKGFIRNSCLVLLSGEILFGGNNGFNIFHPDSLKDNPIVPKIAITNFSIFNKTVAIGTPNSPLSKHINECDQIKLSYKHSVISFEFASLEYTASNQNKYAYKLHPFDKDWNEIGTQRNANYTNLDAGEYLLTIKASNNDGLWVDEKDYKQLKIIIQPPIWKTLWFRLLSLMVIVGTILFLIRLRIIQLKQRNALLEHKVQVRTSELKNKTMELETTTVLLEEKQEEIYQQNEELMAQRDELKITNDYLIKQKDHILSQNKVLDKHQNELESLVEVRTQELENALKKAEESDRLKSSFLANMSHEIRTPMNAIIGFSSLMNDDEITFNERKEYTNIITKNGDSLLLLINDIIDLSKIQANQLQLTKIEVDLSKTLLSIYNTLKLLAQQKSIDLTLEISKLYPNFTFKADELRFTQVLNNLIYNALKFTTKGSVEFGVKSIINSEITFYVKDTGIGIPESEQKAIFDRFMKIEQDENSLYRGAGLGLSISKSLVKMWGGKIWLESEKNIGTTFYFTHLIY